MTSKTGDPKDAAPRNEGMQEQATVLSAPVTAAPPATRTTPSPQHLCGLLQAVARDRDRKAFVELFEFFAPRLKSFYLRGGASAEAADELLQETLLQVWRKAPLFDPARAGASTWIFAIARNKRIDRARKQRNEAPLEDHLVETLASDEPGGEEHVYAVQAEERLHEAIGALPSEQLEVVRLSFFENLPHPEIASRLGLPLGTVKSRLRLAFGKLRSSMEAFGQ